MMGETRFTFVSLMVGSLLASHKSCSITGDYLLILLADGDLALRLRRFPNLWRGKGPSGDVKPILRNTASEETLQTITDWINECTSTHPLCSNAEIARLPTRVIDVGSGEDDIRLHETGQSMGCMHA